MSSENKVAVITGASQGIGAALVEAYRGRGYRIVAIARSIGRSGDTDILAVPGDIADRRTAERSIAEGVARFGRIDTLINNAGVFMAKPFTQYSEADYAAMLGVNLAGFFHMTQLAIAEMEKRGSGHIVQITTSLIAHANSHVPSVLASLTKGGLDAATRSLAIEYAKRGIRVNAVAPGVIKTPMHAIETHQALGGLHPLGRMGEIADIVDAILYLESAAFVTGETLHVDGGQSAEPSEHVPPPQVDFGFPRGDARRFTDLYAFPEPGEAGKSIPGDERAVRRRGSAGTHHRPAIFAQALAAQDRHERRWCRGHHIRCA